MSFPAARFRNYASLTLDMSDKSSFRYGADAKAHRGTRAGALERGREPEMGPDLALGGREPEMGPDLALGCLRDLPAFTPGACSVPLAGGSAGLARERWYLWGSMCPETAFCPRTQNGRRRRGKRIWPIPHGRWSRSSAARSFPAMPSFH